MATNVRRRWLRNVDVYEHELCGMMCYMREQETLQHGVTLIMLSLRT